MLFSAIFTKKGKSLFLWKLEKMADQRKESRKPIPEPGQFDFTEIISKNSWMSDFRQNFLKKQGRQLIDSSAEIHRELFRKYDLCNTLLTMYIKQEILTHEPRVRFKACNDLWECHVRSRETKLSEQMKSFLQVLSQRCYEFLKAENLLNDFIEIDNTTETFIKYKGKTVNLKIMLDTVCPQETADNAKDHNGMNIIQEDVETETSNEKQEKRDIIKNKDVPCDPAKPKKGILKRSSKVDNSFPFDSFSTQTVVELNDSDTDDDTNEITNENLQIESCDTMTLNFVLSYRRSIPADVVFKQFLSHCVMKNQIYFILVFHIGPLVKDEEMVLYKYVCNKEMRSLVMEDDYDLDLVLNTWSKNEGKFVHEFSDSKDSIKDSIYDYQGLEKLQDPKVKTTSPNKKDKKKDKDTKRNCSDEIHSSVENKVET